MKQRRAVALGIGLVVGLICFWYHTSFDRAAGDISWPLCAAQQIVQGRNPYDCVAGLNMPTNMLPTALLVLPFVALDPPLVAGLLIGVSTGLLVWGLLRDGHYWRLWMLLAFPFWQCVQTANWTILMVAVGVVPALYPLLVVKPHAALPVALLRFSWQGVLIGGAVFGLAFLVQPDWPTQWWRTAQTYGGGPLVLQVPPALVLFASLLRWRNEAARYMVLCAVTPLRAFYDYQLLFLLPQTPRQLYILVGCSWFAYFSWFFLPELGAALAIFLWLYLPCLILVLREQVTTLYPSGPSYNGDVFAQIQARLAQRAQRSRTQTD